MKNIHIKEPTILDAVESMAGMTNPLASFAIHVIISFKIHFSSVYLLLYNNDYCS